MHPRADGYGGASESLIVRSLRPFSRRAGAAPFDTRHTLAGPKKMCCPRLPVAETAALSFPTPDIIQKRARRDAFPAQQFQRRALRRVPRISVIRRDRPPIGCELLLALRVVPFHERM